MNKPFMQKRNRPNFWIVSLVFLLALFATLMFNASPVASGAGANTDGISVAGTGASPLVDEADALVPIIIKFKASANSADINDAVGESGGTSKRDHSQIRTRVIEVPAGARDQILANYAPHQ